MRHRRPGCAKIAVVAGGGIGDLLQLADLVEALKHRFAPCDVFIFYNRKPPEQVTAFNPNISGLVVFKEDRDQMLSALYHSTHFDIVVSWRYLVRFKKTRISRSKLSAYDDLFREADERLAKWAMYETVHPEMNNALGRHLQSLGTTIYDAEALSSGLDMSVCIPPAYFLDPMVTSPIPSGFGKYITIHNGSDQQFVSKKYGNDHSTKCLPTATWGNIVERLTGFGISIVQIGLDFETPIPGIALDLRGKTDISGTAAVLKGAICHVDTEGGLVHLARRVHTPSVVAFGPTPPELFGYPGNANLPSVSCSDCWWTTDEWMRSCPLGTAGPACMLEHSAEQIVGAAIPLISARCVSHTYEAVNSAAHTVIDIDQVVEKWISDAAADKVAFVMGGRMTERALALHGASSAPNFMFVCDAAREDLLVEFPRARFASPTNLPAEDLTFDLVVVALPFRDKAAASAAILEGARITSAGGHLIVLLDPPPFDFSVREIPLKWSRPVNLDLPSALLVKKLQLDEPSAQSYHPQ